MVSPGRQDEGRSFIAANLAIVFAQQGQRTLLIDADLRSQAHRSQQAMFKLERNVGLSGILADRAGLEVAQAVPGTPEPDRADSRCQHHPTRKNFWAARALVNC
jgi:protein-tyrosine kinase